MLSESVDHFLHSHHPTVSYFPIRSNGDIAHPCVFEMFGVQWQLSAQPTTCREGNIDLKLMCLGLRANQNYYMSFLAASFYGIKTESFNWRHDFSVDRQTIFMRQIIDPKLLAETPVTSRFQVQVQFQNGYFHSMRLPIPIIIWPRATFKAEYGNRPIHLNKEYFTHFWPEFETFMQIYLPGLTRSEFELLYEVLGTACHRWKCDRNTFEILNDFASQIGFSQFKKAAGREDDDEFVPEKRAREH